MKNKKSQKNIFLENEGDNWFERNKNISKKEDDEIVKIIDYLELKYNSLLEIGCSTGYRLNLLKSDNKDLYGIDPSAKAIEYGLKNYKNLKLSQGTADSLNFESDKFEIVVFGFCLYLTDNEDLFDIANEEPQLPFLFACKSLKKNMVRLILVVEKKSGFLIASKACKPANQAWISTVPTLEQKFGVPEPVRA